MIPSRALELRVAGGLMGRGGFFALLERGFRDKKKLHISRQAAMSSEILKRASRIRHGL